MNPIRDRKLPERSKLLFQFPVPQEGGGKMTVTLPFFENIKITENKRARYQKYDLISRSSQLYTYLGADSRKFTLDFTMSFPHILEEHGGSPTQYVDFVDSEDPYAQKILFFDAEGGAQFKSKKRISEKAKQLRKNFANLFVFGEPLKNSALEGVLGFLDDGVTGTLNVVRNLTGREDIVPEPPIVSQHDRIIDLVMYWTNIIRASVLNNGDNPIYGPPIIRINHGILFQNIPCICTNYSIEPVEEGGYDVATLMPRRIRYTLSLEELRAGDFGKFNPATPVEQDNICGWEAVVSSPNQSIDPGSL
tara:strand:+ start:832 stop:1749 length:918 start_codon:yes stop_codon:yes gene_type:complete